MKLSDLKLNPDNATTILGLSGLLIEALVILGRIDKETSEIFITLLSSFVAILFRVTPPMRKT